MKNYFSKILAASSALALAFTLSCSDDKDENNDNAGGGGTGEEMIVTLDIKDITSTSFTMIEKAGPYCKSDGTLKEDIYEYPTNYTISGSTLSFGGAEFTGNSTSIIGTWNSSSVQDILFGATRDGYNTRGIKVVFTQNTLAITLCLGKPGDDIEFIHDEYEGITQKVIDCSTLELKKGNEAIKVKYSTPDTYTATYNGKTCKRGGYSESQMQTACTPWAYKKTANGGYVSDALYWNILEKDYWNCVKDFPNWFGSGEGDDDYYGGSGCIGDCGGNSGNSQIL